MKGRRILMLWIVLACMLSCTEEIVPTPYTYTKVFTGEKSKTWKMKFFDQTNNGEIVDTFTLTCTTDDEFTFYASSEKAYLTTTGSKKCGSDEPNTVSDSWTFNNASATLTFPLTFFNTIFGLEPDTSLPFIVREAKKNKMVLELFLDEANTVSYRMHFESTTEN